MSLPEGRGIQRVRSCGLMRNREGCGRSIVRAGVTDREKSTGCIRGLLVYDQHRRDVLPARRRLTSGIS
jgi:hypothetical protein